MINHLGDHRPLQLLFGEVTKGDKLKLVTQFHEEKGQSVTLLTAIKKKKLDKALWLGIVKGICEGLRHIHIREILHNNLKSNNAVLQKQNEVQWNPVIIDYGKARFVTDPKPLMSRMVSSQETLSPYHSRNCHRQSTDLTFFSLGKIVFDILHLLPMATANSLRVAK